MDTMMLGDLRNVDVTFLKSNKQNIIRLNKLNKNINLTNIKYTASFVENEKSYIPIQNINMHLVLEVIGYTDSDSDIIRLLYCLLREKIKHSNVVELKSINGKICIYSYDDLYVYTADNATRMVIELVNIKKEDTENWSNVFNILRMLD